VFLGHSVTQHKSVSDATARLIDEEVRRLIEEAEGAARRILTEKQEDLEKLARALLEYETLNGEDVRALLRGEPIDRPPEEEPPQDHGAKSAVPTTAASKGGGAAPTGDFEPEPQPGS